MKPPRGWNFRSLVCERCKGLGWIGTVNAAGYRRADACPFCRGEVRLSIADAAERLRVSLYDLHEVKRCLKRADGKSGRRALLILERLHAARAFEGAA